MIGRTSSDPRSEIMMGVVRRFNIRDGKIAEKLSYVKG